MTPSEVVQRFVERINAGDVGGLVALMTEDHRFIDSLGEEVVGREKMRHGWAAYFRMVPDYRIEVREIFHRGQVVVLIGVARGTYSRGGTLRAENAWQTPAAWRAVVRGDRIAEWQVYADNEPIRQRMREGSA
jgi:ketosteroid isomerase-like protein